MCANVLHINYERVKDETTFDIDCKDIKKLMSIVLKLLLKNITIIKEKNLIK